MQSKIQEWQRYNYGYNKMHNQMISGTKKGIVKSVPTCTESGTNGQTQDDPQIQGQGGTRPHLQDKDIFH